MLLLSVVSGIYTICKVVKESCTFTLTAEHWANKNLYNMDKQSGMSMKEIIKNAEKGRYYMSNAGLQAYPDPHRIPGEPHRILIENCELYEADIDQYGIGQAGKWAKQGKYNLNEEELEVTHLQYELWSLQCGRIHFNDKEKAKIEEIKQLIAKKNWDYRKAEVLKQWQKAHDAEMRYR